MKKRSDAGRSRGSQEIMRFEHCAISFILFFVFSSDITTLTSASYASSLPMHAGQHLLSIQGTFLTKLPVTVFNR